MGNSPPVASLKLTEFIRSSIVIDHLSKKFNGTDIRIAYLYCDYKEQAIQTASNLVACLVKQLIGRPKRLPSLLEKLYKDYGQQGGRPTPEELKMLLVTLCNERECTYIVVDALDECDATHERKHVLPLLQTLPQGSTRLFVTSRPYNEDIQCLFESALQITIAAPESDIRRFVTEKMEEKQEFMQRITPELKERIISTISDRASGMWVPLSFSLGRVGLT